MIGALVLAGLALGAPMDSDDGFVAWPEPARSALAQAAQRVGADDYAVFDADNTLWRNDLEEALLPWMEARGRLSLSRLDAAILPVPPRSGESAWAYYERLCEMDDSIGFLWIAQVFSGFTLSELRAELFAMLDDGRPIPAVGADGVATLIHPPRVFEAQRALIQDLRARGVRVYVVTAALEELVRLVVSDPTRGLGIAPENVIGVNLLVQYPDGTVRSGASDRAAGLSGEAWFTPDRLAGRLSHHLVAPASWYEGKVAAIKTWIHPTRRPSIAAGDSASDLPMLLYTDPRRGGFRLMIPRKPSVLEAREAAISARSGVPGADPAPTRGWILVDKDALTPANP